MPLPPSEQDRLDRLAGLLADVDASGVREAVRECIDAGVAPAKIISDGLSAGMRRVGERFKCGDMYMPEVLVCCDLYYDGLQAVRPLLEASQPVGTRGRMILGTIYGDIHTVGKDVAVPVFQAAGYEVIDLGADVADQSFVAAIREHQPHIVGLGTYMTSTFMHTRETVRAIEAAGLRSQVRIICGGPAVDAAAARRMGADDASDDAWDAVGKLDRLMRELACAAGPVAGERESRQ